MFQGFKVFMSLFSLYDNSVLLLGLLQQRASGVYYNCGDLTVFGCPGWLRIKAYLASGFGSVFEPFHLKVLLTLGIRRDLCSHSALSESCPRPVWGNHT